MYDNHSARPRSARRSALVTAVGSALAIALAAIGLSDARAQDFQSPSVIRKISSLSEKLELTTNTSRILTLDKNIPRVQVNNPELLAVTPLSANQVQISAKKAGVTQINLWDEDGSIHTVDVLIYGDARELEVALQTQFPHSSIKVYRYSESLVLKGFVDRPDYVSQIMRLAEDYAPKVINNISVGGVQQILLKVKVMEISRTKLRRLGVDWAFRGANGEFALNSVSGILSFDGIGNLATNNGDTFAFGIVNGNSKFFGFLDALQQCNVAKILAEPNLVAVSGRPAQFNVGGEIPIVVPQSLGTASIEFKKFGTQVDFLPIVLGNGNIRLEVRPRISEIDDSRSVVIQNFTIPALTVREVDTAVEMKASQTFVLAGLVQERTESVNRGLPYLSDMPIIGVPFRKTENETNEIELLIMVTPEFVDPMDACEAACGGPGYATTLPNNRDLYCGGHVEVPAYCNPISGMTSCGECSTGGCCQNGGGGGCQCGRPGGMITDGVNMPGGVGYDDANGPTTVGPTTISDQGEGGTGPAVMPGEPTTPPAQPIPGSPDELPMPGGVVQPGGAQPSNGANLTPNGFQGQPTTGGPGVYPPAPNVAARQMAPGGFPQYTPPRPYSPSRQPVYMRNASKPNNPQPTGGSAAPVTGESGLIGPIGYDSQ